MKLSIISILILALALFLTFAEAQQNDAKNPNPNKNRNPNQNKIRRVVRRRGRQRTNRQIGFGNRVALAPAPAVRFASAPAVRFAPAPAARFAPTARFAPAARFAPTAQFAPAARFAPTAQFAPAARFAPAPLPVQAPSPQPIQVFEVTPNNINFGEFPRNQLIQVRQPVHANHAFHNLAPAPTPAFAPVGHHFVPSTIVQARANAFPVAPVAKAAPVAAPLPVAAPAPIALPVAVSAPVSAPIPVVRTVAPTIAPVAITSSFYNAPGQNLDNLNTWGYGFEADNGIKQTASGEMKQVGDEEFLVMRGSYQYIGADGLAYQVNWEADENGFRADAPHLPQPVLPIHPEVAQAVEAQLRFAASQPPYVEPEN